MKISAQAFPAAVKRVLVLQKILVSGHKFVSIFKATLDCWTAPWELLGYIVRRTAIVYILGIYIRFPPVVPNHVVSIQTKGAKSATPWNRHVTPLQKLRKCYRGSSDPETQLLICIFALYILYL